MSTGASNTNRCDRFFFSNVRRLISKLWALDVIPYNKTGFSVFSSNRRGLLRNSLPQHWKLTAIFMQTSDCQTTIVYCIELCCSNTLSTNNRFHYVGPLKVVPPISVKLTRFLKVTLVCYKVVLRRKIKLTRSLICSKKAIRLFQKLAAAASCYLMQRMNMSSIGWQSKASCAFDK